MLTLAEMNSILMLFSRVPTQNLDEAQQALQLREKLHAHFTGVTSAAQAGQAAAMREKLSTVPAPSNDPVAAG